MLSFSHMTPGYDGAMRDGPSSVLSTLVDVINEISPVVRPLWGTHRSQNLLRWNMRAFVTAC